MEKCFNRPLIHCCKLWNKKTNGQSPIEHVKAYAKKVNPEKEKEPCLSFLEKTNSEICAIVKKQKN